MAKKKRTKNKAQSKAECVKDLIKKEYTEDEKVSIANYRERSKGEFLKFEKSTTESDTPLIQPKDVSLDVALAKMAEVFGTTDCDLQNCLLNQRTEICFTEGRKMRVWLHIPTMLCPYLVVSSHKMRLKVVCLLTTVDVLIIPLKTILSLTGYRLVSYTEPK